MQKRKRYTEEDIKLIESLAMRGIGTETIASKLNVSASAIQHVMSRRKIRFRKNPYTPISGEIWKNCPYDPDIKISSLGRFLRISTESLINPYVITQGYLAVDIGGRAYSAHRLVAQVFIPNPENKPEVNHKDGNKANNCITNLEWVTPSENVRHAFKTGLYVPKRGEEHHRTSLTNKQIEECIALREEGKTYPEIADVYGVHWKTISRLISNYRRSTERSEAIP